MRERRGSVTDVTTGSPYAPRDACGVGFIARQSGERTYEVVKLALEALTRLAHRGATGSDKSADGAGVLTQIPRRLFILSASRQVLHLSADASFAVGMCYLPADADGMHLATHVIEEVLAADNLPLIGWRGVPVRPDVLGKSARDAMPRIRQVIVARPAGVTESGSSGSIAPKSRVRRCSTCPCC